MKCPKCHSDNPDDSRFCNKCGSNLIEIPPTPTSLPTEELSKKSALDFAPGQYFGMRYQIIEEIGRGGMGRVYKALDRELNRIVVLKMIRPELSDTPSMVERFKKELILASKVTHKNVCRIHDLGEVEGIKFISMQHIEGQDLKQLITQSEKLTAEKAFAITRQICAALQTAHNEGVIHRDLKPQNIMIDKKGNAYVLDFGIAKSLEIGEATRTGAIIGTPHYMSPEQAEGKKVDQRSDIYSLGIIIYEMVTGRLPFKADSVASLIHKHIKEAPKPPSQLNPQIPKALEKIILKCLEKKAEKRYQSADEIIYEIDEAKPEFIPAAKPAKIPWKKIVPLAFIIPIILAILFYIFVREGKPPTPTFQIEWKNSFAVLPFADMSPQKDQEYFCDGMTEEIIGKLSQLKELKVISRTSVMRYKNTDKNITEIGQELGVATILEGSIRKEKDNIRVNAKIINVENGFNLWSDTYERKLESVFAIQDEIAQAIVNQLRIKLVGEEKAMLVKRYTENLEAYNLYLKGRYYWNMRTGKNLKKSIEYFKQAIEKDPTYALAYGGIADCYNLLGYYNYLSPQEAYSRAKAAAGKALELDDTLAEAHSSLAFVKEFYDWDWLGAEREYKRAIALHPSYATAHQWYSGYLSAMGRHKESIVEAKRARELDPLSLFTSTTLGWVFYYARQYDQAIDEFQKTLDMEPNFVAAHYYLGGAYLQKKMYNKAIAEAQIVIDLSAARDPAILPLLGIAYSMSGKRNEAKNVLDELLELSKQRYVSPFLIAWIYSGLGKKDQAFEWLDEAYEEHNSSLIFLKVDPMLDSLRSDPRFTVLLNKMDLTNGVRS